MAGVIGPCSIAGPGRSLGAMTSTPSLPEPEVLQSHQCWEPLRSVSVGRLALWVQDHPDIFPINYKVDHAGVPGRRRDQTPRSTGRNACCLETDGLNPDTGVAWSVVVKGQATAIALTQEVLDTVRLLLFPWQAGRKDHFIRIVPTSVTGRRFTVTPPLTWWSRWTTPRGQDSNSLNEPQDPIEWLARTNAGNCSRASVGRLAAIVDHHADIFPVNYVLDQDSIVFRTGVETKFWATIKDPWQPGSKSHRPG